MTSVFARKRQCVIIRWKRLDGLGRCQIGTAFARLSGIRSHGRVPSSSCHRDAERRSRRIEGMKTVRESAREVPVIADVDVLVVGSGPGGLAACLGAARAGVSTMVVERFGCLGGNITAVGVESIAWYRREKTVDCEGIGIEFEQRAKAMGATSPGGAVQERGHQRGHVQVRGRQAGRGVGRDSPSSRGGDRHHHGRRRDPGRDRRTASRAAARSWRNGSSTLRGTRTSSTTRERRTRRPPRNRCSRSR